MKIINIDNRLKDVASFIDNDVTFADIGTDHGYLPIYLIQKDIATSGYACDVAKMPLNSAIENINKYNLNDKIKTILSDGLKDVPLVDVVIACGMGGNLIINILENKKFNYDTYVLQPNININTLREYLSTHNYKIIDEMVSFAHNKYYEILKVKHGKQELNDLEIKYGPINLIKKTPLFKEKWTKILNKYQDILIDFKGSNEEKDRLNNEINELKSILN